jgi:phosphotransferase system HPr-like phosphotransfer protein
VIGIETEGEDEEQAMKALVDLISDKFGEGE